MNMLAEAWAKRQLEILQRKELAKLAKELREIQDDMHEVVTLANERRKAAMRQDGPDGFVMVQK